MPTLDTFYCAIAICPLVCSGCDECDQVVTLISGVVLVEFLLSTYTKREEEREMEEAREERGERSSVAEKGEERSSGEGEERGERRERARAVRVADAAEYKWDSEVCAFDSVVKVTLLEKYS